MSFIDNKISDRMGGQDFFNNTKAYKFEKIKRAKELAILNNPNIPLIDMGIGEPDKAADKKMIDILYEEAGKPENRWYSDNGILEFQEAACRYLKSIYGLDNLDPQKNIVHGIGSKPALAMIPIGFINPGDISLMTVPGYPVMGTYTKFMGGDIYNLPLIPQNNFYPDLDNIPKDILNKAKLLYINYPNNPTGQVATKEFYEKVVDFAYKNGIFVVSDLAYGSLTYDGYKPLSFLSVDGAIDVGIELHSLSKSFNMTGWRLAFVVGNEKAIKLYSTIKGHTDSGQFRAIQKSGIYALDTHELFNQNCRRYSRRFDILVKILNEIGFDAYKPKGGFYCYVSIPKGTKDGIIFKNAEEACEYILINSSISTVPWDDAGSFLRFSVTYEANDYEEEIKIMNDLKDRLLKLNLVF